MDEIEGEMNDEFDDRAMIEVLEPYPSVGTAFLPGVDPKLVEILTDACALQHQAASIRFFQPLQSERDKKYQCF